MINVFDGDMSIYDKVMFYILLLFALMTNVSTGVTTVCIVLGLMVMLTQKIRTKRLPDCDASMLKAISLFSAVWLFVAFFSSDLETSLGAWFAMLYRFSPFFFVLMYVKTKKQFLLIMIAFALSVIIDCGVAIAQVAVTRDGLIGGRPEALNNNPTFVGSFMLLAFSALLYCSFQKWDRKWCNYLFFIGCMLSFVTLLLTKTRGAWLSFLVLLIVMGLISFNHRRKVLLVIGLFCVSIITLFLVYPEFFSRITSQMNMGDHNISVRFELWQASYNMFLDYPIFGVGQDMFPLFHNNIYALSAEAARLGNPHNNLLLVICECGAVGFVSYVLFQGYLLWRMIKNLKMSYMRDNFAVMGILFFLGLHLSGLTDTNINNVPMMREYWFLIGMSMIGSRLFSKNQIKDNIET